MAWRTPHIRVEPEGRFWRIVARRIDGVDYDVNIRRRLALASQARDQRHGARTQMHHALTRYMGKTPTVCADLPTPGRRIRLLAAPACHQQLDLALRIRNTATARQRSSTPCRHKQFDEYELGAMLEAGRGAGNYLDDLGKTDLKVLSAEEWREFLSRLLTGYEDALRRKLLNNEPPLNSPHAMRGCPWGPSKPTPEP